MLVEKVVQDRNELMTIVDRWSEKGGKLLLFEKNDTLVLKKIRNSKKNKTGKANKSFQMSARRV